MSPDPGDPQFHEAGLASTAIRDLGLTIAGTPLEPIIAAFLAELQQAGVRRVRPRFYLSTEWGVPTDTIAIAIPFYLARPELTRLHAERVGHVEGATRADLMRYLRHEMGHVVSYAYQLGERSDWVEVFGSMTQPYREDYRPQPFSRRFVRHLPGWYAQKHPEEDWAETYAVWMTPGLDWRTEYAGWPEALAKLTACDRLMAELADAEPTEVDDDTDEDVGEIDVSVDEFYRGLGGADIELPAGLDGALRTIFDDVAPDGGAAGRAAGRLLHRLESSLLEDVYRWTGHFPERTRALVRHLGERADALGLRYADDKETAVIIAVTTMVTALAMNHVVHGSYLP